MATRRLFTLFLLMLATVSSHAQQWQTLGPDNRKELGFQFDLLNAVNVQGSTFYAAVQTIPPTVDINQTVAIKRFTGSKWDTIGVSTIVPCAFYSDTIAINLERIQKPYLFYRDSATNGSGSVMTMNGGVWSQVGAHGFTTLGVLYNYSIKLGRGDTPYVLYTNGSSTTMMAVMKYDGNAWVPVGNITNAITGRPALGFDTSGAPYVAYSNPSLINRATVIKWNGTSWAPVSPTTGLSSLAATGYKMATDSANNRLYLAFYDNGSGATVMMYDGSAWQPVGASGFAPGNIDDLVISKSGVPYVSIRAGDSARIFRYMNGSWLPYANTVNSKIYTRLALQHDSIPVVGHAPAAYFNRPVVSKFSTSGWTRIGTYGFVKGGISSLTQNQYTSVFASRKGLLSILTSDSVLHVVFSDVENGGKLSFKKYVNGTWVNEGSPGFTSNYALPIDLRRGKGDTLYLLYEDNSTKLVSFYAGAVTPISSGLSSSGDFPTGTSFCIDTAGRLYVAYSDPSNLNLVSIKNQVNGIWNVFASLATTAPTQVEINSQNQVYACYSPSSQINYLVQVTQGSVSPPINLPGNGFIKIAPNDDVYFTGVIGSVTWSPGGGQLGTFTYWYSRSLYKLSSGSWSSLGAIWGTASVNPGVEYDFAPNLVFDGNSVPYLGVVRKNIPIIAARTPSHWAFFPNQHPMTRAYNLSLALGPDKKLFATYSIGSAYALGVQTDTVPPVPVVVSPVTYCQGDSAVPLIAIGQNIEYAALGQPYSPTPITPSTNAPGTYYYSAKSGSGLFAQYATIEVNVHPKPIITVSDSTICAGDTAIISVDPLSIGSCYWTVTQTINGTTTTASFQGADTLYATNSGAYSLLLNPSGCKSDTVSVSVSPNLQASISISGPATVPIGSPVVVTANVANAGPNYTIYWYNSNTQIATTSVDTLTFTKQVGADYIRAIVNNQTVCVNDDTSNLVVILGQPVGMASLQQAASSLSVAPNPSSGKITFRAAAPIAALQIKNLEGVLIHASQPNTPTYTLDLTGRPSGIYYYLIVTQGQQINGKLVLGE